MGESRAYGGTSDTLTLEPRREDEMSAGRVPDTEEHGEAQGRGCPANDKRSRERELYREPDSSPGSVVRRLWGPPAGQAETGLAGRRLGK